MTGTSEIFDHRTNTHHMLPGEQKLPLYPRIQYTKRLNCFFSGVGYGASTGTNPPGFLGPVQGHVQPG